LGIATAAAVAACGVVEVTQDRVISRSLRMAKATATVFAMYYFKDPQTLEEASAMHRTAAQHILDCCMKNEGLYIKFGQGIFAMNQVLPPEFMEVLKVLLDNAPPVDLEKVKRVVEEDTGRKVADIFCEWAPEAVGSASIAQVHRAVLVDPVTGERHQVAVKVQKPHIQKQIWADLQCYFLFCYSLYKVFGLPIWWSARTIADKLLAEIDFRHEAEMIRAARELNGIPADAVSATYDGDFYIPRVYDELTTSRVLVLEWIEGVKLLEQKKVEATFDAPAVITELTNRFGDMIFSQGLVHCDPHPANVIVRPHPFKAAAAFAAAATSIGTDANRGTTSCDSDSTTNGATVTTSSPAASGPNADMPAETSTAASARVPHQVVLIDWGLAITERDSFRREYAGLFQAILSQDWETVGRVTKGWGVGDAEIFASIQMQKVVTKRRAAAGQVDFSDAGSIMHGHGRGSGSGGRGGGGLFSRRGGGGGDASKTRGATNDVPSNTEPVPSAAQLSAGPATSPPASPAGDSSEGKLTPEEVKARQADVKSRFASFLEDEKKIPRELIFLGRAMNIMRSNNKIYGAKVNRVKLLADAAARAQAAEKAFALADAEVAAEARATAARAAALTRPPSSSSAIVAAADIPGSAVAARLHDAAAATDGAPNVMPPVSHVIEQYRIRRALMQHPAVLARAHSWGLRLSDFSWSAMKYRATLTAIDVAFRLIRLYNAVMQWLVWFFGTVTGTWRPARPHAITGGVDLDNGNGSGPGINIEEKLEEAEHAAVQRAFGHAR
jgi:predicted unusual protein kinase regulating ubiquinone biosynthesis (AarF/ABC1/UbiB family)